jgi:hypothetical protein
MSREEDLIRSTTRAVAAAVREVPPLRLEPAPGELRSPLRAPGRLRGRGRLRGWRSWGTPLIAAAAVVTLAVSLVLVRDMPNGGAVSPNPSASSSRPGASGPDGTPRYYVALRSLTPNLKTVLAGRFQYGIVVGDSLTGQTLATFAPPANTTFQNVAAAADDRTFVVFAVTSSTGSFDPSPQGATLTGSWYEVRLDPGSARPAQLTRLPVKPWSSWSTRDLPTSPGPGEIFSTALSQSGQELAVADIPDIPAAAKQPQDWQEVKVFSVATGRLLHDWTGHDPTARLATGAGMAMAGVPAGTPALTWIDADQALALATSYQAAQTLTGTVRRLEVAGPASGNLMTDSTVVWSGTLRWSQSAGCFGPDNWPPLLSADGSTITCAFVSLANDVERVQFLAEPLTAGPTASIDYQVTWLPEKQKNGELVNPGGYANLLWASPSAGPLIVESVPGGHVSPPRHAYFWAISNGTATPLHIPKSMTASTVQDITF